MIMEAELPRTLEVASNSAAHKTVTRICKADTVDQMEECPCSCLFAYALFLSVTESGLGSNWSDIKNDI